MIGGVAYVTFPMQSTADIIYIGKYNASDDTWYRFGRGGIEIDGESYDDTWYAIDRGAEDADCPTDIEVYKNEHKAAGENNLGFNKGTDGWNCIMAVITDGGPYDNDGSVNGRVVDSIATVTTLLPAEIKVMNAIALDAVFLLADGNDVTKNLIPLFSPLGFNYKITVVTTNTDVELILRPYSINAHATITVTDQDGDNYFAGKSNGALSDPIMLYDSVTVTLVVTDTIDEVTANTTYTFVIRREDPIEISEIAINLESATDADRTISEASMASILLNVAGGAGRYRYEYKLIVGEDEILLSQSKPPVELTIPVDIVATASTQQVVELNIIVRDSSGQILEYSEVFTIQKVDNGKADIAVNRETTTTLIAMVGSDPDGDAADPDYTYQWQSRTSDEDSPWMNIDDTNDASYTITDNLAVDGNEFRVTVTYRDRQGYSQTIESAAIPYTFAARGIKIRTKVFLEGPLR